MLCVCVCVFSVHNNTDVAAGMAQLLNKQNICSHLTDASRSSSPRPISASITSPRLGGISGSPPLGPVI